MPLAKTWFASLMMAAASLLAAPSGAFVLDRILASVNGEIISLSRVERELSFFGTASLPQDHTFDPVEIEQATHQLIDHHLLLAEADRFAIEEPPPDQIDRRLQSVLERFESREAFDDALSRNAMDFADLREMVRQKIKVDQFLDQRIRFFIIIMPQDVSEYYAEHQDEFPDQSLEQAEAAIKKRLERLKEREKYDMLMAGLKKKARIEINL